MAGVGLQLSKTTSGAFYIKSEDWTLTTNYRTDQSHADNSRGF